MGEVLCPWCSHRFAPLSAVKRRRERCPRCRRMLAVPVIRPISTRILPAIRRTSKRPVVLGLAAAAAGAFLLVRPARVDGPARTVPPHASPSPAPDEPPDHPAFATWTDRAAGEEARLRAELGGTFEFLASSPYFLALERGDGAPIGEYAARLEALYRRFRADYAYRITAEEVSVPLPVILFRTREAYRAYCRTAFGRPLPAAVSGYYHRRSRRLLLLDAEDPRHDVLRHEAVHQLLHHYTQEASPAPAFWFHEGLAACYESEDGGTPAPDRLAVWRESVERGTAIPLRDLLEMTVKRFWETVLDNPDLPEDERAASAERWYAAAWALVRHLRHGEEGRRRDAFDDYVLREMAGRAMPQDALALMGADLDDFERRWRLAEEEIR